MVNDPDKNVASDVVVFVNDITFNFLDGSLGNCYQFMSNSTNQATHCSNQFC